MPIPAGIDEEHPIRLGEEGEAGIFGGENGDLNISVSIKPHKYFVRQDGDILYDLHLNVAQAALGETVEVPTMYGKTDLKIPSGTQNGDVFMLKGKGAPHLNGHGKGNQSIRVKIDTPRNLNKKQRQLFEELVKELPREII